LGHKKAWGLRLRGQVPWSSHKRGVKGGIGRSGRKGCKGVGGDFIIIIPLLFVRVIKARGVGQNGIGRID